MVSKGLQVAGGAGVDNLVDNCDVHVSISNFNRRFQSLYVGSALEKSNGDGTSDELVWECSGSRSSEAESKAVSDG